MKKNRLRIERDGKCLDIGHQDAGPSPPREGVSAIRYLLHNGSATCLIERGSSARTSRTEVDSTQFDRTHPKPSDLTLGRMKVNTKA